MEKLILTYSRDTDYGDGWGAKQKGPALNRTTEYYYRNKRAKRVLISGKLAGRYAGYALIERDIRTILGWIERTNNFSSATLSSRESIIKSNEEQRDDMALALFVAIVSFYGRLFTSSEGRGGVKLEKEIIPERYLPIHNELMNYRHNFVAHAGISNAEQVEIVCARPAKCSSGGLPRIFVELRQLDTVYQRDDKKSIKGLMLELQKSVKGKMMKLHDKIHQGQIFNEKATKS